MRFRIRQGNMTLAVTDDEDEILQYAARYRRGAEITVQYHTGTHWKRYALFCMWPVIEEGN